MPNLPTFTVTDATAARIMKVFENRIDEQTGEPLTPALAYKRWLRLQLMEKVTEFESTQINAALYNELK